MDKERETDLEFLKRHRAVMVEEHQELLETYDRDILAIEKELAEAEKPKLNYDKPIVASSGESVYLLVANCNTKSYESRGFDWLNIATGRFNSKRYWETAEEAVRAYMCYEGKPHNVDFDDLAALAKNLTEFEIDDHIKVCIDKDKWLVIDAGTNRIALLPSQISIFIRNLQIMYATMKRQKNG